MSLQNGVWGVVATPFDGDDLEVDVASLARLVEHYERIGAQGLTVLGVFGEAASLSRSERATVLATVRDAVSLPIVVGVTSLGTRPAIDEVQEAQAVLGDRLAAAMVQLNTSAPGMLAAHLTRIHRATGAGIVAQNYPVASGVNIPLDDEIAALRATEGLAAIKEEAAPTALRIAQLAERFTVPVFGGLGGIGLVDELAAGAAGAMTGFSFPETLLRTIRAHAEGGFPAAREAILPHLPLINFEQQPGIGLAIRKFCLAERGLITSAAVRPPAPTLPPTIRRLLVEQLDVALAAFAEQA